ncbi:MAG: hypothetical protein Q4P66_00260 [Actinomycetaceae bacterium]|nr:hypothetical protein [Actinomycetaceae bacterium]
MKLFIQRMAAITAALTLTMTMTACGNSSEASPDKAAKGSGKTTHKAPPQLPTAKAFQQAIDGQKLAGHEMVFPDLKEITNVIDKMKPIIDQMKISPDECKDVVTQSMNSGLSSDRLDRVVVAVSKDQQEQMSVSYSTDTSLSADEQIAMYKTQEEKCSHIDLEIAGAKSSSELSINDAKGYDDVAIKAFKATMGQKVLEQESVTHMLILFFPDGQTLSMTSADKSLLDPVMDDILKKIGLRK